jgi:hypothetical protein
MEHRKEGLAMKKNTAAKRQRKVLILIVTIGLMTALAGAPALLFRSSSAAGESAPQTRRDKLENYDIRTDKEAVKNIAAFRAQAGKDTSSARQARQTMKEAEDVLRRSVPTLKVEYNEDLKAPEVITPNAALGKNFLTEASTAGRADILRRYLRENDGLIGLRGEQVDDLKLTADYTNPDGNLSFVHLEQKINGVPVFRGEVKAGFTKQGEIIRVVNNLAPGLADNSLSENFGEAENAVRAAFENVSREMKAEDSRKNAAESSESKVKFGAGDWATTAEKMYFPIESGVAGPAGRVLVLVPQSAY